MQFVYNGKHWANLKNDNIPFLPAMLCHEINECAYNYSKQPPPLFSCKYPTKKELEISAKWPEWEKEVSQFEHKYDTNEKFLMLDGSAVVKSPSNSLMWYVERGFFVTVTKGIECEWEVLSNIKKKYDIC